MGALRPRATTTAVSDKVQPPSTNSVSRDVAGGVAGEKQQRAVELVGTRWPPERCVCRDPRDLIGILQPAGRRGGKKRRSEGVDPHAAGPPLVGKLAGQREQADEVGVDEVVEVLRGQSSAGPE